MDIHKVIADYARLIVDFGVKVRAGDTVVITAPVECRELARQIAQLAYQRAAKEVVLEYNDDQYKRLRLINTNTEVLTDIPQWKVESKEYYARQKATMIFISYPDPELYQGIDPVKINHVNQASRKALKNYSDMIYSGDCAWLLVSYPSPVWAKKVFPDLGAEKALSELWKAVMYAVRLDQADPVKAWQDHQAKIQQRVAFLNSKRFKKLIFSNQSGTNLTIGLPQSHLWVGASSTTNDGLEYVPNMPTEEVFTVPDKYEVNGNVKSSKPLSYAGQLIEDFSFTFAEGRLTNYSARVGQEVLDNIFKIDDGANYLGEVALVSEQSPLAKLNTLFYDTLYDENASCHLAFGKAYADCLDAKSSCFEQDQKRINDSLTHIDFMVGTADLSVVGVDQEGIETPIFINGDWC